MMILAVADHAATAPGNTLLVVILAMIAVLPGLGAIWVSLRTRRDTRASTQSEAKKDLVELGANILSDEITRLSREREQWERERRSWMEDKADLLQKVNHLSNQLDLLNAYLVEVLAVLRKNGLEPPAPPRQLHVRGSG